MKIAKIELSDKIIFNKIVSSLNPNGYVECGICGAIRVEAKEMARTIHSFIQSNENADEVYDYFRDILGQIIESEPIEFESYEKYEKWKSANEDRAYHFLDDVGYISKMYGEYDELIIYNNKACDCFSKNNIREKITVDE